MSSAYAVAVSFALLLAGAVSLAAVGLLEEWAARLAIGGSGAVVLTALYLASGREARRCDGEGEPSTGGPLERRR
jgi:hypothetical protein